MQSVLGNVAKFCSVPPASPAKRCPLRFSAKGASPLAEVAEEDAATKKEPAPRKDAALKKEAPSKALPKKDKACADAVVASRSDEEIWECEGCTDTAIVNCSDEDDEEEVSFQRVEQSARASIELAPRPPDSCCWDWPLSRREKIVRVHDLDKKILKTEVLGLRRRLSHSVGPRRSVGATSRVSV